MAEYDAKAVEVRQARERHPAEIWYLITIALLVIVVVLGLIAAFVPWVMADIGVGSRAWAYPFKTCFSKTFSPVHEQNCMDNDFFAGSNGKYGAPVTQGDSLCESLVLTVIGCVISSVLGALLTLVAIIFLIFRLWSRPMLFASIIEFCIILILPICLLAWILWIFFAERTCQPNSIFPVRGYSYGWICYLFVSVVSMVSIYTGTRAFLKVKNHVVYEPKDDIPELDGYPEHGYPEQQDYTPLQAAPTPAITPLQAETHLTID
eukprot:GGOE01002285.1.p1 GENE.GGOE01002285.1~~GGOE01002285.1.p1  ORF type:complete len:275 (-),score=37.78 GGOE01002285.1:261-1049(-)